MRAGRWFGLVACCCVTALGHATGLAWTHITASDDGLLNFYFDANSVVEHGTIRSVRLLFDYTRLQQDPDTLIEHRSIVELTSIDCLHHTLAPVEAASYDGNMGVGRVVVEATSPQPLRYATATPGSVDDRVIDSVCNTR